MKKTKQFKIFLIAAFVAVSSGAFAQVKIGSNPTLIETGSNLEVEASTNGRKVKVDKTTGQLTIADGTEGLNKVLTSDVNGGASWSSGTSAFRARRTTQQDFGGTGNTYFNVNLNSTIFDEDSGITLGGASKFTVVKTGTYVLSGGIAFNQSPASSCSVALYKNGVQQKVSSGYFASGTANGLDVSIIDRGVVGDTYELRANNNTGLMQVITGDFSGTRVK